MISTKEKIKRISQKEFNSIDEVIMKLVFEIHNDLGRFCDEKVYHNELSYIANKMGFQAENEVEISVTHKDFTKKYYLDVVINHSCIYELKTVNKLIGIHKKQLLNYILLLNIYHSKLINFRTPSVEYEFVSTSLNTKDRLNYKIDISQFKKINNNTDIIVEIVHELLSDWGAFLDLDLYKEAVIYFLGGAEKVIQPIDILKNSRVIGQQRICKLNENEAFHLSVLTKNLKSYEKNIMRMLNHTKLDAIQWVNFNKRDIIFKTIE